MSDYEEGIDREKVGSVIVIGIFVLLVIIGAWAWHHSATIAPYKVTCENNPRERYAQPCGDRADCVSICANRLASKGGS